MGIDSLGMLFRLCGVLAGIRGHIPDSGGFESFRDRSGAGPGALLGTVAAFVAAFAGFAAVLAGVTLLAIRWLS
jgi:hypothetical protein